MSDNPNPIEFVKKHKIVVGVSAVALVGIIALSMAGGGSTTTTGASVGTPQSSTDDTQIALATIQAGSVAQQVQADAATHVADTQAQLQLGTLQLQNQNLADERAGQIQLYSIGSQTQTQQQKNTLDAQVALHTADVGLANASLQADVLNHQTDADVSVANIQSSAQVAAANAAAKAQVKSSSNAAWGTVIAAGIALFSDARLKTTVERLHTDKFGLRWYAYRYNALACKLDPSLNSTKEHVGVIAQELLTTLYRHAVFHHKGYLAVDYSLLPSYEQGLAA